MDNSAAYDNVLTEIQGVYNGICKAFQNLDISGALQYFSDSSEMIKISNGHVLRGKKQLDEYWSKRTIQYKGLDIEISNVEIHIMDKDHVWATADESISFDENMEKAVVSNIFIRTNQGWKILLDHTTYLPKQLVENP
ncbi:MAG: DUF3225 domain-containing protein [Chloroflexi bacterium]|nr:DUF3225 domain-containing protein [Chloroflexota bacterium]